MGLDFKYTCPRIDKNIEYIKSKTKDHLEYYIKEEELEQCCDELYGDIEEYIEDMRKCNMEMRDVADRQIDEMEQDYVKEIDHLKYDIELLNRRIKELEDIVDEQGEELESLKVVE